MKQFMFFQKNEDAFERIFDEAERLEAELERFIFLELENSNAFIDNMIK